MSWTDRIEGCFGSADKIFAGHYRDRQRAAEMLYHANKEDVGLEEYKREIRHWLKSQGCNEKHIDEQMQEVIKFSNYLNYD
jgi:hypothetical protein